MCASVCGGATHSPAQHDLCVADSVGGGDVRSSHGPVREGGAAGRHLVGLGGDAVRTGPKHVHSLDTEPEGGAYRWTHGQYSDHQTVLAVAQ